MFLDKGVSTLSMYHGVGHLYGVRQVTRGIITCKLNKSQKKMKFLTTSLSEVHDIRTVRWKPFLRSHTLIIQFLIYVHTKTIYDGLRRRRNMVKYKGGFYILLRTNERRSVCLIQQFENLKTVILTIP